MKKKVKKYLKKQITGITFVFAIFFLVVGLIVGFVVDKLTTKEGITKVELTGDSIVNVQLGGVYTEEGYTFIIDDVEYNEFVKVNNSVNTEVEGTYVITYTLEENGNNIVLTRVVNVLGGVSNGE